MLKHQHRMRTGVMASALALSSLLISQIALAEIDQVAPQATEQRYKTIAMDPLQTPAFIAPLATKSLLTDIALAGQRVVAVGEHGTIVYSDDEGVTWQQSQVPISVNLTALTFVDERTGWAVGHHGVIVKTIDAGKSWQLNFDGMDAGVQVIAAAQVEYDAAVAAEAMNSDDAALERLDIADLALGDAKASIEFGPAQPLMAVWFENANHGIVVGSYGQIFRTQDGGQSWTLWKHKINNPGNFHYYDITQAVNGDLYIVGEQGGIYRSSDNGENWITLASPYRGSFYGVLSAVDEGQEVLLAYGFNGNVVRSTDAGQSWRHIQVPGKKNINGGVRLADGSVLLTGAGGVLLRSTDGGGSFNSFTDPSERPFVSLAQVTRKQLALVGIAGVRLAQLDGHGVSF